jgi:hypothetical protein
MNNMNDHSFLPSFFFYCVSSTLPSSFALASGVKLVRCQGVVALIGLT